jgi:hypothetical protein
MGEVLPPYPLCSIPILPKTKRADLSVNPFVVFGGAEGESHALRFTRGQVPSWAPPKHEGILPSNSLGSITLSINEKG